MKSSKPELGKWYQDNEGHYFEIVACDDDGAMEVQYFDGTVEEIDIDTWNQLEVTKSAPPEDWTGPFDDLEADDIGDTDKVQHPETTLEDELEHMDLD